MAGEEKTALRRRMQARAAGRDPQQIREDSLRVQQALEGLDAFRRARTVALYSALGDEPQLDALAGRWMGRKRIVMPVVEGDDLVFREYTGPRCLREGAFGIGEPCGGEAVDPAQIDFVAVPGVAFSRCGERLGRGRGFYDRFLAGTRAYKAGVCFAQCVVERIACEPHDVEMDAVVTPEGAVFVREGEVAAKGRSGRRL